MFANFFLLTLYVQQVLGYSALKTGLTFLATAGTVIPVAGVSQALVTKVGPRPVLAVGLTLITGGMLWFTQIPVKGSFLTHLLPGYLLVGVGMAFSFIPVSIAALAGVEPQQAGLASGLITAQQIGGALGVAIAATVAFTHTQTLLASGHSAASAATSGFALGFWVIAGISAVSVVACLVLVRDTERERQATAVAFLNRGLFPDHVAGARVVNAANTLGAEVLSSDPQGGRRSARDLRLRRRRRREKRTSSRCSRTRASPRSTSATSQSPGEISLPNKTTGGAMQQIHHPLAGVGSSPSEGFIFSLLDAFSVEGGRGQRRRA